ncbi:MAG: hypothetical protein QW038_02280 [Nanopusillaceae archaeon]
MRSGILLIIFLCIFFSISFSQLYPYPYISDENFYTLEWGRDYYTYKELDLNISHDVILVPYYIGISGSATMDIIYIDGAYFNNDTYYKFIEAEDSTKSSGWIFITNTSYSNSTYIETYTAGEYVEFEFEGTTLVIYYRRSTDAGMVNIYINDNFFGTLDLYGTDTRTYTIYYLSQNITKYKIRIEVSEERNSQSSGNYVRLDGFRVGASLHLIYLLDKLKFADDKYVILRQGTISSSYIEPTVYLFYIQPLIYNITFYIRVANPTDKTILLNIGDAGTNVDYITGSSVSTSNKIYCSIPIPPNTNFTTYILNTTSGYCALRTNSTHVGMQRTFRMPNVHTGEMSNAFRIFANNSGLLLDAFWVGLDAIRPTIKVIDNTTGNDLSLGGYIDCANIRSSTKGLKIVVSNLIPNSQYWRIRLLGGLSFSYTFYTSASLTANLSGVIETYVYDSSARLCGDYDYSNIFFVFLDNTASGSGGTTGSTFVYNTPPIYALPWSWKLESFKIIDVETNEETCVLRNNKYYKIIQNVSTLNGNTISSGVSVSLSFTHLYATDGILGYENPIFLYGTTPYILWSDRTITLSYNSTSKLYEILFKTPEKWKYDGHISAIRVRITNTSSSTYRIRYASTEIPSYCRYVIFTNHYYSGKGIDVVLKDLDFGTSSNHPFYTTAGGEPPTFNDNINDVYAEDKEKIVLIYNSTGTFAQPPIVLFYKKYGMSIPTYSSTSWSVGYTYQGTYRQSRNVITEAGLSKDYFLAILKEYNAFGYEYYTYLYYPANSDWYEVAVIYPDIPLFDYLYTTVRPRIFADDRYYVQENLNIIDTAFGKEINRYFYKVLTSTGFRSRNVYALSYDISKQPVLSYTTSIPLSPSNGIIPCNNYCYIYIYTNKSYGFSNLHNIMFLAFTEGISEWRKDSWLWTVFTYNYGDLPNVPARKIKYRFIYSLTEYGENENDLMIDKYHYIWRYGYPTSYSKESIDIWFNKRDRSYAVGEKIIVNFLVRNYTIPISTQFNVYVLDEKGNIIYNNILQSNSSGLASIQITLQKEGVYRVLAKTNGYFGIGFVWVKGIRQIISTDKEVYAPGEVVRVYDYVYDTSTLSLADANVYCNVLNPSNQITTSIQLAKSKNTYTGGFILEPTADSGVWKISCFANAGGIYNMDEKLFYVFVITKPEETISNLLLTAPSNIKKGTNITYYLTTYNRLNKLVKCDEAIINIFDMNYQPLITENMILLDDNLTYSFSFIPQENLDYIIAFATCKYKDNYYQSNRVITQNSIAIEISEQVREFDEAMIVFGLIALIFGLLAIFSQEFLIKIYFVFASFLNILLVFPSNLILGFYVNSVLIFLFIFIYTIFYLKDIISQIKEMIKMIKKKSY